MDTTKPDFPMDDEPTLPLEGDEVEEDKDVPAEDGEDEEVVSS